MIAILASIRGIGAAAGSPRTIPALELILAVAIFGGASACKFQNASSKTKDDGGEVVPPPAVSPSPQPNESGPTATVVSATIKECFALSANFSDSCTATLRIGDKITATFIHHFPADLRSDDLAVGSGCTKGDYMAVGGTFPPNCELRFYGTTIKANFPSAAYSLRCTSPTNCVLYDKTNHSLPSAGPQAPIPTAGDASTAGADVAEDAVCQFTCNDNSGKCTNDNDCATLDSSCAVDKPGSCSNSATTCRSNADCSGAPH